MELDPCDEENFEELSTPIDLSQYEENFKDSWAYKELYAVRNVRPSFNSPLGMVGGLVHSGLLTMITQGKNHGLYLTMVPIQGQLKMQTSSNLLNIQSLIMN